MNHLKSYLEYIKSNKSVELANSLEQTALKVKELLIQGRKSSDKETGLLLGNIQSGKTAHMFASLCQFVDHGFPFVILLTTDNIALQRQTLDRVKSELSNFCICGEGDSKTFLKNNLVKPTIVVLKKNARVLKAWVNNITNSKFLTGNYLLILDDEADAASLNTKVNQQDKSTINACLEKISSLAFGLVYLQVTATPQALILQRYLSNFFPKKICCFAPGEGYYGGDFFFNGEPNENIVLVDNLANPVRDFVVRHLLISAISYTLGKVSNALVHPSVKCSVHDDLSKKIENELSWCSQNFNTEFLALLEQQYQELTPKYQAEFSLKDLFDQIIVLFEQKLIKVLILNSKNIVEAQEYESGCNFIVGGNSLGRGITFPCLNTFFYTRTSKNSQADTLWQHNRIFGYDRNRFFMKIYMPFDLYQKFSIINESNNIIFNQVSEGKEVLSLVYDDKIAPTRKNVIDTNKIDIIYGGINLYIEDIQSEKIEALDQLLLGFDKVDENTEYFQVNIQFIKEILSKIKAKKSDCLDKYIKCVDLVASQQPASTAILMVRTNRNITKGTGALLSENLWKLSKSFNGKLVLTMIKVNAGNGWGDKDLWIPNIKFPESRCYFLESEIKSV